jgi:hypothetical protein
VAVEVRSICSRMRATVAFTVAVFQLQPDCDKFRHNLSQMRSFLVRFSPIRLQSGPYLKSRPSYVDRSPFHWTNEPKQVWENPTQ